MIEILTILFSIYFVLKVYTSIMQIGYITKERRNKAVLLPSDKYIKSASYAIVTQRLAILEHTIEYIMYLFWIYIGLVWIDAWMPLEAIGIERAIYYVMSFLLISFIIGLPLDIYKTFVIDKEYGFTKITIKTYILDNIKSLGLTVIIGSAVIAVVAYIIESSTQWWIYSFIFIMIVIVLINALYPTIMGLMYNKFEPLKDIELKNKIENLLVSVGFKSSGVFQVDASKRDSRLNAYFGGLGSTKRVVLFDTLIDKLSHEELIAVLGHELGHFKNKDLFKNIFLMAGILFIVFAIVGNIPESFFNNIGVFKESGTIIVIFMLLSSLVSFFLLPIINAVSRHNEYAADEFGSHQGGAENLSSALLKLIEENLSFPKSHGLFVFFYYSHPPLISRLEKLGYKVED